MSGTKPKATIDYRTFVAGLILMGLPAPIFRHDGKVVVTCPIGDVAKVHHYLRRKCRIGATKLYAGTNGDLNYYALAGWRFRNLPSLGPSNTMNTPIDLDIELDAEREMRRRQRTPGTRTFPEPMSHRKRRRIYGRGNIS